MLSDARILELRTVLGAQRDIVHRLTRAANEAEVSLSHVVETSVAIAELERLVSDVEDRAHLLHAEDVALLDTRAISALYDRKRQSIRRELGDIGFTDWPSFVRKCRRYSFDKAIDPLRPYEAFLTEADHQRLEEESYATQYRWDVWDYMFVGVAGVLAAIVDFFLVGIPTAIKAGEFAGQEPGLLTGWLRKHDLTKADGFFGDWTRHLEKTCKTPYDRTSAVFGDTLTRIRGMSPKTHRLQSFGHDPLLGFVFGVLDILRGTMTGFSYNPTTGMHTPFSGAVWSNTTPVGLGEAFLRHLGHLVSDVTTPMGLPAPLATLFQGLNIGSISINGQSRTIGEVVRWMYLNGFDFRHFLAGGLSTGIVECIVRAYIMLRHYMVHGELKIRLANHPKYRSMLLTAHGVAAAANAGKVALMSGNPLAINQAQWLAFLRYLLPSLKYWLFDKHRLELEHMQRVNEQGWRELDVTNRRLMACFAPHDLVQVELGS